MSVETGAFILPSCPVSLAALVWMQIAVGIDPADEYIRPFVEEDV